MERSDRGPASRGLGRRGLLPASMLLGAPGAQPRAQPQRPFRIGTLTQREAVDETYVFGAILVRALGRLGYRLQADYTLLARSSNFGALPLADLAAELAAAGVAVIIAFGTPPALAARDATSLPVVVYGAGDLVGTGLAESMRHPGGRVTGVSDVSAEMTPKRLQLLRDLVPGLREVAIVWNAADPGMLLRRQAAEAGAAAAGLSIRSVGVTTREEIRPALAAMTDRWPDALLVVSDALTSVNRRAILAFAAEHRLPAMYEGTAFVRDGGLIAYGPDVDESLERIAALTDRILRGAAPADLPLEQPTRFRLTVNLRAAQALGLSVPPLVLAQANEVVE